jgi:predicted phage-related endonuclease
MIEELKSMNEVLRDDIIGLMNGEEVHIEGANKATYKEYTRSSFDSKAFQGVHPELYASYVHETAYRRFTVQ